MAVKQKSAQWRAQLGAIAQRDGTKFRVWSPEAHSVEVVIEALNADAYEATGNHPLERDADGMWSGVVSGVRAGNLYRYRLNGERLLPDPASRYQPFGVHGPSQVVDASFQWTDNKWRGVAAKDLIIYELHIGTFSPEGTFRGAAGRFSHLADLGVTAIELMPVADFPGNRNWGYDGVCLFAPARCYGRPDDLRKLVDSAHAMGIAVILDVVYNHFGPDGAYAPSFSPFYFTDAHTTPWGSAINLDGPHSRFVREFFIQNALYWLHEYHMDGLRLDATHALIDDSPRHFLAELSEAVDKFNGGRKRFLIAEDHRNLARLILQRTSAGYGMDAVWSDDFHHQMRRMLAGDKDGYFQDFQGATIDVAATIRQGWFYTGQHSKHFGAPRGTDSAGIPYERFVFFIQNHDQIGNRAMGDRLHHTISEAAYRAACALLLLAPETPLLFMGQEFGAGTPFCYFTDHNEELGKQVTIGRRNEFARFSAFSDPAVREKIPDPQAASTFEKSRLNWNEVDQAPHINLLKLHRDLALMRKDFIAPYRQKASIRALNENALLLKFPARNSTIFVIAVLQGAGQVVLEMRSPVRCRTLLNTEDSAYGGAPDVPTLTFEEQRRIRIETDRPCAVVFQTTSI